MRPMAEKMTFGIKNLKSQWMVLIIIGSSALLALLWNLLTSKTEKVKSEIDVSTHIPMGFVLVPIEIQNYEALNAIMPSTGVVDLITVPDRPESNAVKLASQVRILRAPFNQNQFAVLVPQEQAPRLVRYHGPLFAVVQNGKSGRTQFAEEERKRRGARIYVEQIGE